MSELPDGTAVVGAAPFALPSTRSPARLLVSDALLTDLLVGLAGARTQVEVLDAVLSRLAARAGVRGTAVVLRAGRNVVIQQSAGYDCLTMAAGAQLPLDAGLPVTEAVRRGRTTVQGSGPAWIAVPFGRDTHLPGALLLSLECAPPEATADLTRLHRLAGAVGDALHRAELVDRAEAQLAAVSAALAEPVAERDGVVLRTAAADGQVGGDVVASFPDRCGGRWLLAADVVGTGLVAGLLARSVRAAARAAVDLAPGPAALLAAVEQGIADTVPPGCFVTAAVVRMDAGGRLVAASAGHPPPVLLGAGAPVELAVEPGPPLALGAGPAAVRPELHLEVPAGAVVLLYTDGLVERRTPDGVRQLEATTLAADLPDDLAAAADRLLAAADAVGPAQDDVSLLLARAG